MAGWLVRYHRLILLVVAVVTVGAVWLLVRPGLRHDYRLEAFVARNDDSYHTYRRFMQEFTSNEVAIIAVQTDDALSSHATAITREILDRVRQLPAVERAQALAALPQWALRLGGDRLAEHRLVADNLLSRDGRTSAILLHMHGEGQAAADRRDTVARLRAIVKETQSAHPEASLIIAGPYVTLIDMYSYVDRDLLVFSIAAFALIGITLWAVFRRPGPMIFALGVGISATLVTLGVAICFGFATSLITQMIVILVMVLSVANCVHLAVASEETAEIIPPATDRTRRTRATATLSRMLTPCSGVMVTTAAGFAAVCISKISPVRNLGLLMVFGLAVALASSLAGSVLLTGPPRHVRDNRVPRLPAWLRALALWADQRRVAVVLCFAVAGVFSVAGFGRLQFESDFVKNFRPRSEVRTSYEFIEANLSPVGSMEIVVRADDGNGVLTPDNVRLARTLGDKIVERHDPIRKAMSLADLTTLATPSLPATQDDLQMRLKVARTVFGEEFEHNFLNTDRTSMRLNLRAIEGIDVGEKLDLAEDVHAMARSSFGSGFEIEVTGLYVFYAKLVAGLLLDQYRSLALTIPAVFLLSLLVLRSVKVALVAMVANLLPLLFCLGAMAWARIPVNMTTTMMLSVTLGIAVDDTLHYLWRFRTALGRTGDYRSALLETNSSVGRACVFTTVVVAGGFWILMLSQFLPTAYFGGLVGFTMMGTLAADLVLLPVLVTTLRIFGPGAPVTAPARA